MLVANGYRLAHGPLRYLGGAGTLAASFAYDRPNVSKGGSRRNLLGGPADVMAAAGVPNGYLAPSSWMLPQTGGGMASITRAAGSATVAATGSAGRNATASIAGTGTVSSADAVAIANLAAALAGTGSVTATATAVAQLVAALSGSATVAGAAGAIANLIAALNGSSTVTAAQRALAHISADIDVSAADTLTADEIAAAVWDETAAAHDTAGSMGEKMNDAGSAANPWTEVIESGYTAAEILRLIASAELGKLTVGTGTVTIRDVNDTVDRITATVDDEGNRLTVTLDPS